MALQDYINLLKPYKQLIILLLPVGGLVIGWILKSFTDLFFKAWDDWAKRRECVFYLLQSWKNILDYERKISDLSGRHQTLEEYEEIRTLLSQELNGKLTKAKNSLKTGIISLASVDPTAAAQLDNTLKNFIDLLSYGFIELVKKDEAAYKVYNKEFFEQIDWTLEDMENQTIKLAATAGPFQKKKTRKWYNARIKGGEKYHTRITELEEDIERSRNDFSL